MLWGIERTSKRPKGEGNNDYAIPFFSKELVGVHNPNDDAVILAMIIAKHHIQRTLVDGRSSTDILSYYAFVWMDLPLSCLKPVSVLLVSFTSDTTRVEGEITLFVTVGTPLHQSTICMTFIVIHLHSTYNAIPQLTRAKLARHHPINEMPSYLFPN